MTDHRCPARVKDMFADHDPDDPGPHPKWQALLDWVRSTGCRPGDRVEMMGRGGEWVWYVMTQREH